MKKSEVMNNLIESCLDRQRQSRRKTVTKVAVFAQSFLLLFQIGLGVVFTAASSFSWVPYVATCAISFHVYLVIDAVKTLRKVVRNDSI